MDHIFPVCVIGAGLAGSECAYQLARSGISVALIEMRPGKRSPAHVTDQAAELVCSNSLRSNDVMNAVGLLKEEMAVLDSLIIRAAYHTKVAAGSALAVDREAFSGFVAKTLRGHPKIHFVNDVVVGISHADDGVEVHLASGEGIKAQRCVVATGPLTDETLAAWIREHAGQGHLYFYDSIAPIIEKDSIAMTKAFFGSRYDRGETDEGDYINCPMTSEEYHHFIAEIKKAELAEVQDFDKALFFEGCLPIEEMISRGDDTLLFGPMKPVGLQRGDGESRGRHHAVVQLRKDNLHDTLYNMVGFQTRMKWPEQKRIFRMIPGLECAEFARLGAMHRNTYICSPALLSDGLEFSRFAGVHFAGQITGCEGYVESAAVGLYVGLYLREWVLQKRPLTPPPATTALGALLNHIRCADKNNFQPMNVNFGLFPETQLPSKKFDRKVHLVKRAFADFREWYYGMDLS